jgi:hypothetical protein
VLLFNASLLLQALQVFLLLLTYVPHIHKFFVLTVFIAPPPGIMFKTGMPAHGIPVPTPFKAVPAFVLRYIHLLTYYTMKTWKIKAYNTCTPSRYIKHPAQIML